ncbi:MAG: T9SS type A sorting domain-containing protein, partial [Saprospiraceae bacterium]|nr:T9SS type A sorting domain-containing protein [Saprospiraceae bacterium]
DNVTSDPLGCVTRIEREWVVGEWWCSESNEMIMIQVIEVKDTKPPVITSCPADMTISTDSRSCSGEVVIPPVTFTDACMSDIHVNMQTPQGTLLNTNGATLELEAGMHTITFEVVDACHNMTTCEVDVLVVDEKSPVAICEQDLIVTLNSNGRARIQAEDFNLESFDDCSDELTFEVRRMDDPCGVSGTDWADEIHFCCEDVAAPVMVAFKVTDASGNTNQCMVEVEVQDKRTPTLECIDDVMITCADTYPMNNLPGAFGFPTVVDNCPSNNTIREVALDSINQCGIGSITRKFYLIDAAGATVDSCEQKIIISGEMNITMDNIDWPEDFEIDNVCEGSLDLHPDNLPDSLAYPVVPDGFCNQIGFKFTDEVYDATTGSLACFKIIRTWKVIDWCEDNDDHMTQVFPTWEFEQIIKVSNSSAPMILSACQDTIFETFSCDSLDIELGLIAEDDCTPFADLLISYEIDEGDDGDIDQAAESDSVKGKFAIGVHRIYWEVLDRCGQVSRCEYTFEVRSMKAATPICLDGVSIDLIAMDMDPMIPGPDTAFAILTPDMINHKSEHPCGYDIQLSFSPDVNDTELVLTCADVGEYDVELWVTSSNGAQSSCQTSILVTANDAMANGLCGGGMNGIVDIEGNISTLSAENVEGVEVQLMGSELPAEMTSDDGMYAFNDMTTGGSYEVIPSKDDDHLNGVSTLDIVMMTRHVLGITEITSPYLKLAADVNNNGSISATDIIELRKVILGHYDNFPSNTSWRFIDANYTFIDPVYPWDEQAPESYMIPELLENMNIDFLGIKTGDISGDASANGRTSIVNNRDRSTFELVSVDRYVEAGESFNVTFTTSEDVLGWQLEMITSDLEITGVDGRSIGLNDTHFFLDEELMRMSVNESLKEDAIFTVSLKANADGYLSDMIQIVSERFASEAYISENSTPSDVVIEWIAPEGSDLFAIEQNQPNPWLDQTSIGFTIPSDGNVTLIVRDVAGKLLKQQTTYFRAGENRFQLRNNEILASGVLIYEIIHNGQKLNKRMIKLK